MDRKYYVEQVAVEKSAAICGVVIIDLTKLEDCGNMNLDATIRYLEEMKRKEQVLKEHTHKISQGKDGRYRTYVTVDGKNKLIAKTKLSDLEDYLVEFYESQLRESTITFSKAFTLFVDYKEPMVSDNTIYKYNTDYNRFFKDTDFAETDIQNIKETTCVQFITNRIKKLKLTKKSYEALYSYISGVMRYMWAERVIRENPMERLERKTYYRFCLKPTKDPKKRIISEDEMNTLDKQIEEDREKNPKLITCYAAMMAKLTGMRVGELAALTWDSVDFDDRVITVDKAEIYHFATAEHEIGPTKTGEIRYIPITDKIMELLLDIKRTEDKYGFTSEFVFSGENGRITKNAIGKYVRSISKRSGLKNDKSIHSYRRTLNSKLKLGGVDSKTAASMLGHSVEVNESCYSYDITDMEYKRSVLTRAQLQ